MPYIALIACWLLVIATGFTGWINHVLWTFNQADNMGNLLLGLLGCFLAPIGAVHGIYLWF